MKIKILRDITLDIATHEERDQYYMSFRRNDIVKIESIIPLSKNFSNFVLPSGDVLIDVGNDSFSVVE